MSEYYERMPRACTRYVVDALRRGLRVPDRTFDCVYPQRIQAASARFWTPIDVALTAARWLGDAGCRNVLDVGSGAGKFCIVTSLAGDCRVQGIEQRDHLVDSACRAAASYEASATFAHGTIEVVDPDRFDAFYFYNPFDENNYFGAERLDDLVELSEARCFRDLAISEAWLDQAETGTCVLTYHGFGGRIPDTYDLVRSLDMHNGELHLWTKHRGGGATGFRLELGECVLSSEQLERVARRLTPSSRERIETLVNRPFS
jgi:hypothetical protein